MTGCQDQVQQLSGSYSYKISGTAIVDQDTIVLSNEIGAMDIHRITADSAMITFNALNGPAYATTAVVDGQNISLAPYKRSLKEELREFSITAKGEGRVYDETILFIMHYSDTLNKLEADSLTMLCKKN